MKIILRTFTTEETRLIDVLSFADDQINRDLIENIKKFPDLFEKKFLHESCH